MTGVCAASDFMTLTLKKITTIETRDKYKRTIMKFSMSEVTGTHNRRASGATPTGFCNGQLHLPLRDYVAAQSSSQTQVLASLSPLRHAAIDEATPSRVLRYTVYFHI